MEAVQSANEVDTEPKRFRVFHGQFWNWRMLLMRVVINGLTLILVALLLPNIYFVDKTLLAVLLMAIGLGILNFVVKPIVQFLTLPFIFATYGFVVVLINTVILLFLNYFFSERFYVGSLVWAILGGLVMGIVASFLESLLGLNIPVSTQLAVNQAVTGSPATYRGTIIDHLIDEDDNNEDELQGGTK